MIEEMMQMKLAIAGTPGVDIKALIIHCIIHCILFMYSLLITIEKKTKINATISYLASIWSRVAYKQRQTHPTM